jgi:hypothetical protein
MKALVVEEALELTYLRYKLSIRFGEWAFEIGLRAVWL